LSGFIFFWLYSQRIAERKIDLLSFGYLRFSRLYPLHLATLLFVLVAQVLFKQENGSFFVYPFNDAYHFVLQLFFISNWGFERGFSFNAPIWSVSVEVLLYIIFAFTCLLRLTRWWHLLLLALAGYLIVKTGIKRVDSIGTAILCFFCGCLSFKLYLYAYRRNFLQNKLWALPIILILLWVIVPYVTHHNLIWNYAVRLTRGHISINGFDIVSFAAADLTWRLYEVFLFPLTIVFLALLESYKRKPGQPLAWLGEASYSCYLLHFPLQMVFYMMAQYLQLDKSIFYSPITLGLFFAVLIPLSVFSYRCFEHPVQDMLRKRLTRKTVQA
jgi:peptidoglycan/LPS O-acetylase OafA/YrhL